MTDIYENQTGKIPNDINQDPSERKVEPSIFNNMVNSISDIMQKMGFNIISSEFRKLYALDIIALKVLQIDKDIKIILIVPLIIDTNQHDILVSEQFIRYDIEDSSKIKEINPYGQQLKEVAQILFTELTNEQRFFQIVNNTLKENISIEKTIEHKSLYFTSEDTIFKIRLDPILVSYQSPLFSEKAIPFAYQRNTNVHLIGLNDLSSLLDFLEQKYVSFETHITKNNIKESYNKIKEKNARYFRLIQIPFIGYLALFTIIFFSNLPLITNLFISLGYATMGIYIFSSVFLYFKVFREKNKIAQEFLTPFYKKKFEFTDEELLLLKEDLPPEFMEQLGYEYFGKEHSYKTLIELEHKNLEQEIIDKPNIIQEKIEEFYEPKGSQSVMNKNLIEKYSSFLED